MEQKLIHTPDGVRDVYGTELRAKKNTEKKIIERFRMYGYKEIETPAFEYFDIFSNEIGTTPSRELYKFFDKEGDTLVLRPDFTPSIARCASKYFLEADEEARLCYRGRAYNNTLSLQGKLKETTQVGAELINDGSADADADVIAMVIETMKEIGFSDFTVSIGQVDFFKGLCDEAGLDDEDIAKLREQISVKNYFGAAEFLSEHNVSQKIQDLLLRSGDVLDADELNALINETDNERSKKALLRLKEVYELMQLHELEQYVSIDLGMLSKFHYYTGLIFKAYTYGAGDAVVKGGRYDGLLEKFGKEAPAIGCVFLLDDIMSALNALGLICEEEVIPEIIEYSDADREEAFKKIAAIRASGKPAYGRHCRK